MKLKKWIKVALLIVVEILTITIMLNLKTNVTSNMKILLTSSMIALENLIMFIEN